jgi:hypothetical protein
MRKRCANGTLSNKKKLFHENDGYTASSDSSPMSDMSKAHA